jgi:hypothetical protein
MKRPTLIVVALLCVSAGADSGWWSSSYPGPQPFNPLEESAEHPDVVMVDEEVRISLGQAGAGVYAVFTFRNEGPAQTVPMYFPLERAGYWDYWEEEEYRRNPEELVRTELPIDDYGFRALVDREGDRHADELETELVQEVRRAFTIPGELYADVYVSSSVYALYEVSFAAGETLFLEVGYFQEYGAPKHALWTEMFYPVYSGGSWKGPIGHGTIEVGSWDAFDWHGRWQFQSVGLPPAREETDEYGNGELLWEFSDLEPGPGAGARVMMVGHAEPWGVVLASGGINFRALPDPAGGVISAHPLLEEGEFFTILERRGDWWRVMDSEDNLGWLRWRYIDPDTGEECIYAAISPGKTSYHALESGA